MSEEFVTAHILGVKNDHNVLRSGEKSGILINILTKVLDNKANWQKTEIGQDEFLWGLVRLPVRLEYPHCDVFQ